jgi:tol-pal system protein YbgF
MKKQIIGFGMAALLLLLHSGCSSITMLRVKELQAVESKVESLNAVLAAQNAVLMKEQKNQNELLRLMRADMQVRFEELSGKVDAVGNSLSESKVKLTQIEKKTQDFQEQFKAKSVADSQTVLNQKQSQLEKLFQIAYGDFMAGRFDIAMNGFADIMSRYPDDPLCDDATYWYAECLYGKKDMDKSEQALTDYLRKYKEGKKVTLALFKLGLVYENKRSNEKRKMVWQKLMTSFPDSPEAASARDRLDRVQ